LELQDLTVVLTASSVFGCFFEAIKQPVLNGYILAGSLVGPDGLALIKEMVQIESLAQARARAPLSLNALRAGWRGA
jgi:Kef-type K+ transport system membrane component KefB